MNTCCVYMIKLRRVHIQLKTSPISSDAQRLTRRGSKGSVLVIKIVPIDLIRIIKSICNRLNRFAFETNKC